jgi:hypothetical protein
MKGRQNGRGLNDALHLRKGGSRSGKFLANLVPLMEDIQRIDDAMVARSEC